MKTGFTTDATDYCARFLSIAVNSSIRYSMSIQIDEKICDRKGILHKGGGDAISVWIS